MPAAPPGDAAVRHVLGPAVLENHNRPRPRTAASTQELLPHELLHAGVGGFGARQHAPECPRREAAAEPPAVWRTQRGPVPSRAMHNISMSSTCPGTTPSPTLLGLARESSSRKNGSPSPRARHRPAERLGDLLGPEYLSGTTSSELAGPSGGARLGPRGAGSSHPRPISCWGGPQEQISRTRRGRRRATQGTAPTCRPAQQRVLDRDHEGPFPGDGPTGAGGAPRTCGPWDGLGSERGDQLLLRGLVEPGQ